MQMQLDLDESEAGHYEELANKLLEKIDRMTEERDGLQILCEEVQREREILIGSIEGLKMDSNSKDDEVKKAFTLLHNMNERIIQKDEIINQIMLERDRAVAMIENDEFKNKNNTNNNDNENNNKIERITMGDNELLAQLELAENKLHVRSHYLIEM